MKKFITVIPFQVKGQLGSYLYRAVGNRRLQMEEATSFPILTAVNGYLQPGEQSKVIALVAKTADGERNLRVLRDQMRKLCAQKGYVEPEIVEVELKEGDEVATHVETFQKLIDQVDDDDELFACVTYGTKPLSQAVLMAVQYAYRIKRNTSISCIVYGSIDRSQSSDPAEWTGAVYDETALIQLDEIVRLLAERGVANPRESIRQILAL
ncbi:TM1812 family CRISPR-associated protein [uncultured Oscillibacter sp.]|uniref:TM1812 family CRISPR-associated protein n=1 Tax=uncultured Oscillibacter sp. TaxID=876091 RepID=UPI00280452CE|nr:TM1812 family CRISPR-associated protein [uncultured Oscillibacter sp.]